MNTAYVAPAKSSQIRSFSFFLNISMIKKKFVTKLYGYTFMFFCLFFFLPVLQRETIFMISFLHPKCTFIQSFRNGVYSKRKEFAPLEANSFLSELTSNSEGRQKSK